MKKNETFLKVRGFYRIQINEGDPARPLKIVGDSGWKPNMVTNNGFDMFLCRLLGSSTGSKQVNWMALGTGTAPASNATTLPGECVNGTTNKRVQVTISISNSTKLRFTATFNSTLGFVQGQSTLSNVGLYDTTGTSTGTLFAGSTYAGSTCDTNQNVNVTYDINFA